MGPLFHPTAIHLDPCVAVFQLRMVKNVKISPRFLRCYWYIWYLAGCWLVASIDPQKPQCFGPYGPMAMDMHWGVCLLGVQHPAVGHSRNPESAQDVHGWSPRSWKWVCLKIVYPYTQWFCWSLSLLNGYNWGYTPFSDIPKYVLRKSPRSKRVSSFLRKWAE